MARFRRAERIRDSRDYRRIAREGRRRASRCFVVLWAPAWEGAPGGVVRLGVTVSRKVGSAVTRNRVKRRIREWFRQRKHELAPGWDLVVIARRPAAEASWGETTRELDALTAGLRLEGA